MVNFMLRVKVLRSNIFYSLTAPRKGFKKALIVGLGSRLVVANHLNNLLGMEELVKV